MARVFASFTAYFKNERYYAGSITMMFDSILETVESYGSLAMLGFCVTLTIIALVLANYCIARPWQRFVVATAAEWDDLLFDSFSKRLYFFITIGGINLSVNWIIADDSSIISNLAIIFIISYILLSTSLASVIVKHIVPVVSERFSKKSNVTVSGGNPIISFFLRAVIWFGGLNIILIEIGWDLNGIFASLAVFSLILGIAMQQTIGNIMNSFILAVDRPFEVGDRIEVEGLIGSVVSVGVLSTKVLTYEETLVVIPNNKLVETTLINHARGGGDGKARRISLIIPIGVDYREDIDHVKYTLLKLTKECPYVIIDPMPRVLLTELGDFSKTFKIISWIADYTDEWFARDWLLKEIDHRFAEEGITIPYPISVKLPEMVGEATTNKSKAARQKVARVKMEKEEKRSYKERKDAKHRVAEIDELLVSEDKKELPELEDEKRELEKSLTIYEIDDV